jgi:twinkle protein
MVVSGLAGEDERRALDYISTRLEMMVKELNYALLIVSHVNDVGQTRGSRYISKVADIRIDLHRNLLADDSLTRNTTNIYVPKNRYCGRTGLSGSVRFDPLTNTYRELINGEEATRDTDTGYNQGLVLQ